MTDLARPSDPASAAAESGAPPARGERGAGRALLDVRGLVTAFDTEEGRLTAVDGVAFRVATGRTLGIVGESGCGKSVSAMSIVGLLPRPMGRVLAGEILFEGRDLLEATEAEMRAVRGAGIGVIFQEPMTALNPVHRIGRQLVEAVRLHGSVSEAEARRRAVEMLDRVGIPAPEVRFREYPHQLSGGMRQRVMIAMALINRPRLLIADEPTTALDVTVQAQILHLIDDLRREMDMGVILITHDLGVIAQNCDDVVVMYAGRIVEQAPVRDLFRAPRHPYTRGLLDSIPRLDRPRKSRLPTIVGMVPSLSELPEGCRFAKRCPNPHGDEVLATRPPFREVAPGHWVECCPCFAGAGAPAGRKGGDA